MYYQPKSLRLPNVLRIHEDELLYSYLLRLSHANGFLSLKEFVYHTGVFPLTADPNRRYRTVRYDIQSDLYPLMQVLGVDHVGADELYLHTSLYPLIYPLSTQAMSSHRIGMLSAYRSQSKLITPLNDIFRELHFCPLCREQDQQQFGAWYYHRSHQIPGVTVCHRHGVPLHRYLGAVGREFDMPLLSEALPVREKSFAYAVFAHDLLQAGLRTDIVGVASATLIRMKQMGYTKQDGEVLTRDMGEYADLLQGSMRVLLRYFPPKGQVNMVDCLVMLLFLFRDVATLSQSLLTLKRSTNATPDERLSERICPTCGHRFLTTPYRILSGWSCPDCDATLGDEVLLQRLFDRASGGDYELLSARRKAESMEIRHVACGRVYTVRTRSFLEEHQRCSCPHVRSPEEVARRVRLCGDFSLQQFDGIAVSMDVLHHACGNVIHKKYARFIRHPVCPCMEAEKPVCKNGKIKQPRPLRTGAYIMLWLQQHFHTGEPINTRTLSIDGYSQRQVTQTINNLYRAGKLERIANSVYIIRKGDDHAEDH